MLSRKVVRDSIRGISESELRLGEELMADGYYYPSEGRYSVCHLFSVIYRSMLIASCSRLARRGGIKRISANIYDEARKAMVDRLKTVYLYPVSIEIM